MYPPFHPKAIGSWFSSCSKGRLLMWMYSYSKIRMLQLCPEARRFPPSGKISLSNSAKLPRCKKKICPGIQAEIRNLFQIPKLTSSNWTELLSCCSHADSNHTGSYKLTQKRDLVTQNWNSAVTWPNLRHSATWSYLQPLAVSHGHVNMFYNSFAESWPLLLGFGKTELIVNCCSA